MVQEPLRRHRARGESECELSERTSQVQVPRLAGKFKAEMHSIHPSEHGGFTWVICRLTICEDVMCVILAYQSVL